MKKRELYNYGGNLQDLLHAKNEHQLFSGIPLAWWIYAEPDLRKLKWMLRQVTQRQAYIALQGSKLSLTYIPVFIEKLRIQINKRIEELENES